MTVLGKIAGIAALVLLASLQSLAAASDGKRVALIVANEHYSLAPQAELANPLVDADIVAPALREAGFEVTLVRDADLEQFDAAVSRFATDALEADIALFYYSGHGFAVADGLDVQTVLMSTSADLGSSSQRVLRAGGITLEDIMFQVSRSAKTALFFVDACRSEAGARSVGGDTDRVIPVGAVRDVGARNILVGLSTSLGKTASDGEPGQGTPFARSFATHIGERGIRIDDAFNRIRQDVESATNGRQVPEIARIQLDSPPVLQPAEPTAAEICQRQLDPTAPIEELEGDGASLDSTLAACGRAAKQQPDDRVLAFLYRTAQDQIGARAAIRSSDRDNVRKYLEDFPNGAFREQVEEHLSALVSQGDGAAATVNAATPATKLAVGADSRAQAAPPSLAPQDATIAAIDPASVAGSQSLLLEASDTGKTGAVPFSGTVDWSKGVDDKGLPTLIGKANIPARNLSVQVLIRKNSDVSLPASQLMELNFTVSDSFVGGSIAGLPGVLMKNAELV